MDTEQRVLIALVKVERAGAERIIDAAGHRGRQAFDALVDIGRGRPFRPFRHVADAGDAGEGESFLADGDAITDRLAAILDQIKVVIIGVDDDGAGQFLAVIVDDGAAERLGRRYDGVARLGELGLVVRLEGGFRGGLIGGCRHTAGQCKAGGEQPQDNFQRRHGTLPIESLALAATILRPKRDDSINHIIRKNRRLCQRLRAPSALRRAGCDFCAAKFASSCLFLGRGGSNAKSGPRRRRPAAINATPPPQIWIGG